MDETKPRCKPNFPREDALNHFGDFFQMAVFVTIPDDGRLEFEFINSFGKNFLRKWFIFTWRKKIWTC